MQAEQWKGLVKASCESLSTCENQGSGSVIAVAAQTTLRYDSGTGAFFLFYHSSVALLNFSHTRLQSSVMQKRERSFLVLLVDHCGQWQTGSRQCKIQHSVECKTRASISSFTSMSSPEKKAITGTEHIFHQVCIIRNTKDVDFQKQTQDGFN